MDESTYPKTNLVLSLLEYSQNIKGNCDGSIYRENTRLIMSNAAGISYLIKMLARLKQNLSNIFTSDPGILGQPCSTSQMSKKFKKFIREPTFGACYCS